MTRVLLSVKCSLLQPPLESEDLCFAEFHAQLRLPFFVSLKHRQRSGS